MVYTFTDAVEDAVQAHRGQKDKGGQDYLKHPLRLAMRAAERGLSLETQHAAILHDTVEDGSITIQHLEARGCPESVCQAVTLLTHVVDKEVIARRTQELVATRSDLRLSQCKQIAKEEEYLAYVSRLATNEIARAVKLLDLEDNSNLARIPPEAFDSHEALEEMGHRLKKYAKARRLLTGGLVPESAPRVAIQVTEEEPL